MQREKQKEQIPINWHEMTVEETSKYYNLNVEEGISEEEAKKRNLRFGPNSIVMKAGRSPFTILIAQFQSILVILLVIAVLVALLLNERIESFAILSVILINAFIGFVTEFRAEKAVEALQKQTAVKAHVIRDGIEKEIDAKDITIGDVVLLFAGFRVPADGRLIEAADLQIDESSLTGESLPVFKIDEKLSGENTVLAERKNMCYMGSIVTGGRGEMIVTGIGKETEVGMIGDMIDSVQHTETPLQKQINQFGRSLLGIVLFLCTFIVIIGYLRGIEFARMVEIGISLAISTIPEGLPAVATITLALGVQRMSKINALIRKMHAVETLGATTVICTDKTGTLTKNELTVKKIVLPSGVYSVFGSGYNSRGDVKKQNQKISLKDSKELEQITKIAALCNDAGINVVNKKEDYEVVGDPTEVALLILGAKLDIDYHDIDDKFPRVDETPFDSDNKFMTTIHKDRTDYLLCIKGATQVILDKSTKIFDDGKTRKITEEEKDNFKRINEEMGEKAFRVLSFAYKKIKSPNEIDDLSDLIFVGLIAMSDPLRDETKSAIEQCKKAGIRVIMITGDQLTTAETIAEEIGINISPSGKVLKPIHANELIEADDEKLIELISNASTFARVSPEHKLNIVRSLQSIGEIVAMTGDGINDAPALKSADIGVAMGHKGTQVAKEASHIIISDDNFATIIKAIEEGRTIYANIRKFIVYLFSCNLSEIATVFFAIIIGLPVPINPLQLLWLNVVTDVFPALSLALEPKEKNIMQHKPRDPKENLVNKSTIISILWQGIMISAITLISLVISIWKEGDGYELRKVTTISFMVLALSQTFHVLNSKSSNLSAFTNIFKNIWTWCAIITCLLLQILTVTFGPLSRLLKTEKLDIEDVLIIAVLSLLPILITETIKFIKNIIRKLEFN